MNAAGAGLSRPVIAFDSAAAHCAAALLAPDGTVLAARFEAMARGQAEALVPLLEAVLAEAGIGWRDIGGIAVGTGPGNFTGIRIAVATARGLALALGVPAVGVTAFEVMRDAALAGPGAAEGDGVVCLQAPRGMVLAQAFRGGVPEGAPFVLDPDAPGIAAPVLAGVSGADVAERIGRIGLARLQCGAPAARPAPCYVRPPDAAPAPASAPRLLA